MIKTMSSHQTTVALAVAAALLAFLPAAMAQTAAPAAKKSTKAAPKAAAAKAAPVDLTPTASPEQIDAAQRVYYGSYECEAGLSVDVVADPKHDSYVLVKHMKSSYVMKPVLSSTGAVRLEDVRGESLMVQIAAKSMLLNTKTGQRIVDACISPKQKELMAAAKSEVK